MGRIFKVTRERVRQIEAKAVAKLQHPVRSCELQEYVADSPQISAEEVWEEQPEECHRSVSFLASVPWPRLCVAMRSTTCHAHAKPWAWHFSLASEFSANAA